MRNAVGRVYTADELATCRSIAFADDKVACIARAGRVANVPPNYPAPRVHQPPYLPPPPPAEYHRPMPPQPVAPPVTGRYDSTFGHVELFFQGNALRGEYPTGELACQQRRQRLECNWRETNGLAGTATFTVFASGDMSGPWRTHDNRQSGNWQLRRRH